MIQLGQLVLEHPFILAPMAGITSSPFRRLMRRMGSAAVVSELVSANGISFGGNKSLRLMNFHEEERPVGVQIFGEDPERLCAAAREVEKLRADFVDINLGCPVPKVVRKGGGAALCRDLQVLEKILRSVVSSVKLPVSIKIRSGWDLSSRNAVEVAQVAASAGVSWLTLHGRTKGQGYSGEADWDYIAEVKSKSPIPVIGNGDIATPELAIRRLTDSKVDAVMIGRGMLRNPFIFEQSNALLTEGSYQIPDANKYMNLLRDFRNLLEEEFTPRMVFVNAKKFMSWFSSGFNRSTEFRKKVFQFDQPEKIDDLWSEGLKFFVENDRC
ncbi:MAG: tRNA dihydrouridine synthase DusB [Bdellovibrionota bacterium]